MGLFSNVKRTMQAANIAALEKLLEQYTAQYAAATEPNTKLMYKMYIDGVKKKLDKAWSKCLNNLG